MAVPAAYIYVPIDGGRAVVRWNGQAKGWPMARPSVLLPGRFDSRGGGVFVYRRGRGPDGILRVRQSDGTLNVSYRNERVDGWYEPITGDFDGNGYTDILWRADGWNSSTSYLWQFRADGSHASRQFDGPPSGGAIGLAVPVDANADGIMDILWQYDDEQLWIMHADGTHTVRRPVVADTPGWEAVYGGNIGPDDGVTRRRMVSIYEGDLERLYTFNLAGQSTRKELRPRVGNCCKYQRAIVGHFREGYTKTLFFYSGTSGGQQYPEYLQDITAGGNILTSPAPQITASYTTNVGDYDGNGYDDVLLSNRTGATWLFSSDGTSFMKSDPADVPERSLVVALPI